MSGRVYDHRPLHSHAVPSRDVGAPSGQVGGGGALAPIGHGPSASSSSGPILIGAGGGPSAGGPGGPPPPPHAARLNDLLEFVKVEFDNVAGESVGLRAQREEYEQMIAHHANEINAIRAIAYDLERKYHDDKRLMQDENARLLDENTRLRRELDARSSSTTSVPASAIPPGFSGGPARLPPMEMARPGSGGGGAPNVGHGPSNLFGSAMSMLPSNGERERDQNGAGAYSNGGAGGAPPRGTPVDEHPNKRPRPSTMGDDEDRDRYGSGKGKGPTILSGFGKPPTPLGGSAFSSAAFSRPSSASPLPPANQLGPPPLNAHPSASPLHNSSNARPPTPSSNAPIGGNPPPAPSNDTGTPVPEKSDKDFDPEAVAGRGDLKKEGSDWMTMFNPNVKRVLDVGLVHTLVHDSVVCCVRFSPDGKVLATGCNRNTTLYDTRTGAKISVFVDESVAAKPDNYVRSTSFSPDGKFLATGSEDRIIRIWNIAQKRISKVFQGHKSEIYSLAFSPDGRKLVSGSGDKTARMWDLESGNCLFTLPIDDVPPPSAPSDSGAVDAGVTSVVMSPDGKYLAAGSLDTIVRIWDANTGALLDKLKGHKDSVYSVAFSPDGKFLVSGSLDRTLKMWDIGSLKSALALGSTKDVETTKTMCMTTLHGHKDYVLSVDISPDGAWIVSGSKDRGVQFWDPTTAKAQFMLQGHKNSVISVAVAAVGGLVATGSGDWSARIWNYTTI